MVSLQGPRSSTLLEELFGPGLLPESKRNRLVSLNWHGETVIVARTGYTGESVCFELFVPSSQAVAMWQRLTELGAAPIGLGARDSLRLEAGLPLYGHELGEDKDGVEIPIFANSLAQFAVRQSRERRFVGDAALHHQREEFVQIRRNELRHAGRRTRAEASGDAGCGLRRSQAHARGSRRVSRRRTGWLHHAPAPRCRTHSSTAPASPPCRTTSMRCAPSDSR